VPEAAAAPAPAAAAVPTKARGRKAAAVKEEEPQQQQEQQEEVGVIVQGHTNEKHCARSQRETLCKVTTRNIVQGHNEKHCALNIAPMHKKRWMHVCMLGAVGARLEGTKGGDGGRCGGDQGYKWAHTSPMAQRHTHIHTQTRARTYMHTTHTHT